MSGDILPPGWASARIQDLVDLINGFAFKASDWGTAGLPIIRIQNLNNPNAPFNYFAGTKPEKFMVNTGDLLFAWSGTPGTSFGAHIWRGGRAWLNQHIFKVKSPPHLLDSRFLRFALIRNLDEYIRAAHGAAGLAHITKARFEDSTVGIAPLNEQRRIVAAIEEQFSRIDAGVEALQRARRNLHRMREAVLQAAVTGRLVPQDRSDEPAAILLKRCLDAREEVEGSGQGHHHAAAPDLDGVPEAPLGWVWTSLDVLAEIVGGVTKDAKKEAPQFPDVPYLRVANVQRGYLDLSEITTIRVHSDKMARLRLLPGDILLTEGGDRDKLGRGWVWEGQIDPCIHQNHVFRARLYSSEVDPRFVSWHANTFGKVWFVAAGKQTTNLASVSLNQLRRLPVPLPPALEQRRIAAEVERMTSFIDALSGRVEAALSRAASLRKAVLKAAFTGCLVAQDPADESAEVLLDRIKATRSGFEFATVHSERRSRR